MVRRPVAVILSALVLALAITAAVLAPIQPRTDRVWAADHARAPRATFVGRHVTIDDVRNFRWLGPGRFVPAYERRTYDLDRLESAWFIVVPFGKTWRGPAHSFVSFGFHGDSATGDTATRYVAISVEARREPGERYGIVTGLLKRFEVLYLVGDERDLIGQRAVIANDETEVYPISTSHEKIERMFVEMLQRANALLEHPEFYNTITNNCTSNLVDHVNAIAPHAVPQGFRTVLPGYSDEVAYALGLIDTRLPLADARKRYRVNERAQAAWSDSIPSAEFSRRIRADR